MGHRKVLLLRPVFKVTALVGMRFHPKFPLKYCLIQERERSSIACMNCHIHKPKVSILLNNYIHYVDIVLVSLSPISRD